MTSKTRSEARPDMAGTPSQIFTKFVGNLKAKPHSQQHMSLGFFSQKRPAKGFSIAMDQPFNDEEQVITSITPSGGGNHYEYTLHVINKTNKVVSAEVWRI